MFLRCLCHRGRCIIMKARRLGTRGAGWWITEREEERDGWFKVHKVSFLWLKCKEMTFKNVSEQLPIWEHVLRWVEMQLQTRRGDHEVAQTGTAVCWELARRTSGQTDRSLTGYLLPLCEPLINTDVFSKHGKGTHVWIHKRDGGLQYFQNNQYHGDFLHGQRHGYGVFYYAGGAVYEGEWKNNKKNGQVLTFTLKFCFWRWFWSLSVWNLKNYVPFLTWKWVFVPHRANLPPRTVRSSKGSSKMTRWWDLTRVESDLLLFLVKKNVSLYVFMSDITALRQLGIKCLLI